MPRYNSRTNACVPLIATLVSEPVPDRSTRSRSGHPEDQAIDAAIGQQSTTHQECRLPRLWDHHVASHGATDSSGEVEQVLVLSIGERCAPE
jgi:hypothetical protein